MLRFALALRLMLLAAAVGAGIGAILMFWVGGMKIAAAGRDLAAGGDAAGVVPSVMAATDAFLFGVVLVIFAYAIAFGFVFDLSPDARQRLPRWMRVEGVSELKHTLVEVILVYLVVDFATDWAQAETHATVEVLVLPVAIVLIAAAFRLLKTSHPDGGRHF
jgi:uncharacterized membrane protein YqhA